LSAPTPLQAVERGGPAAGEAPSAGAETNPGGAGDPRLLRRGPVSETWLAGGRYEKRYRVLWPWIPLAGLLKANMPALDARVEAANAERIRALGVEAPRPLGTSARWRLHPLGVVRETTVALAPLEGAPLDALAPRRGPEAPPARERRRIARALGEAVRRLHDARIFHGDLYLCHLLWDGRRVGVLDVARAVPRRCRLERRRAKDLAALLASASLAGVGALERAAFLAAYSGARRGLDAALARAVLSRAARLMPRVARG
jgi:tRNA A-37 threonylcarbamoyl transferase component Bud32